MKTGHYHVWNKNEYRILCKLLVFISYINKVKFNDVGFYGVLFDNDKN